MKVLFDYQIFLAQRFGGINRYFVEIAKLNSSTVSVERIIPDINFTELSSKSSFLSTVFQRILAKFGITGNKSLRDFSNKVNVRIGKNDFDIFHPTYYSAYFLKYLKKPFVITVYDMIHEIYNETVLSTDFTSSNKFLLCQKASHIIAISEKTKEDLINVFSIPSDKITVTLLASDFENVSPRRPTVEYIPKQYILFVGGRGSYKNFYFAAVALAEVLKADPNLHLLCTGHAFSAEEVATLSRLGIEQQVCQVFLKDDSELAWAYRHARLFIFPSLYEGFGFPLLEAFACSCPVISSNGGSLPEVGGDAALYFNPKSISEIRSVAYKALYDEPLRTEMIAKGHVRLKLFSWDKCRMETVEVYKKIMALKA